MLNRKGNVTETCSGECSVRPVAYVHAVRGPYCASAGAYKVRDGYFVVHVDTYNVYRSTIKEIYLSKGVIEASSQIL